MGLVRELRGAARESIFLREEKLARFEKMEFRIEIWTSR